VRPVRALTPFTRLLPGVLVRHPGARLRALVVTLGAMLLLGPLQQGAAANGADPMGDLGVALCFKDPLGMNETVPQVLPLGSFILQGATLTIAAACVADLDLNGSDVRITSIAVGAGSTLTIRDSIGTGKIVADASSTATPGIALPAGATLIVIGGSVDARGGPASAGIGGGDKQAGGTVTVSGGTVTANGGVKGAGIGGGDDGDGGSVTVSGGTVTATGGARGAGIGGGDDGDGGSVTVSGGMVTATGGERGAGIGGGGDGAGRTVTISGGTVTATGGDRGAGIGGGDSRIGGSVTVSGGTVSATGGGRGAGIGGGDGGDGGSVMVTRGTVTATGGPDGAGIGGGYLGSGGTVRIDGGTVTVTGGAGASAIGAGALGAVGTLTLGEFAVRVDNGLTTTITFVIPQAAVSAIAISCLPATLSFGQEVVCTITGGDSGIDVLWRASFNPVIASAGVTLDADGVATFRFVVPAAALGQVVTVELVDWLAPISLGVVGGPVPTSIPSGGGPVSAWSFVLLALTSWSVLQFSAGRRPGSTVDV
jgi:hypothetical protein